MHIEIGFGNPWWITSRTENPKYILRSKGWNPSGQLHSIFILIQVRSFVITVDSCSGFALPEPIISNSKILIGFTFT